MRIRLFRPAAAGACALVAAVVLAAAMDAPPADAAAELTISPTIIERTANAGDEFVEQVQVSAGTDQDIVVQLVHADFGFDDASYELRLIRDDAKETTAFSTREWFSLPKPTYRIKAGTTVSVPVTVKVPDNTPGGTYLGAALMRVVPGKAEPGSQVQAVPESGPLLFIKVAGGDPPTARLTRFTVPKYVRSGPVTPKITIENTGDDWFRYEGTVKLTGPGKDRTLEITRQYVVPDQPRDVRSSADKKAKDGALRLGTKGLGFGRYTVHTKLRIEPTGRTLEASRTFWVVPTWAWVLLAVIGVVLAACIALLVRWWVERRRLAPFLAEELAAEGLVDGDGDDVDAAEATSFDDDYEVLDEPSSDDAHHHAEGT